MLTRLLLLLTFIAGLPCLASPAQEKKVVIGISFSIPPYVVKEENNGLELEILRQSFAVNGYKVLPSYLPLARTFMNFQDGSLDGVINVKDGMIKGYYSDVVITFRNKAVSLEENNLTINSIDDLSRKSIVAFQRASTILGKDFGKVVEYNSEYREVADQSLQVKQLFKNRAEVIILEEKIFKYFRRWLFNRSRSLKGSYILTEKELRKPVIYHDIFLPSEYKFAFISEKVRDDFNDGLRTIRNNGLYEQIINTYNQDLELPLN